MRIEIYLGLSATLVGLGIGSALARRNIVSIILALATAGVGALVAMITLDRNGTTNDGMLFALCFGAVLTVTIVIGCSLAYRRYMASGTTDVNEGSQLRH